MSDMGGGRGAIAIAHDSDAARPGQRSHHTPVENMDSLYGVAVVCVHVFASAVRARDDIRDSDGALDGPTHAQRRAQAEQQRRPLQPSLQEEEPAMHLDLGATVLCSEQTERRQCSLESYSRNCEHVHTHTTSPT